MIKKLKIKYECGSCGEILILSREIVIDKYIKKIEIVKPDRCSCGKNKNFTLLNVNLEDGG